MIAAHMIDDRIMNIIVYLTTTNSVSVIIFKSTPPSLLQVETLTPFTDHVKRYAGRRYKTGRETC